VQVILLKVPPPLREQLERRLQSEGGQEPRCPVLLADGVWQLPGVVPPGLVVLGDTEDSLEALVSLCRQVHERRSSTRTQLVVLTQRPAGELEVLARAGADECLAPPGDNWGVRLIALGRRLHLDGMDAPALTRLEHTRDFLRKTLDAVPDPVFVKDREHRFFAMNAAFVRLMGKPEEVLLGKSDYDFVPAHQADIFWQKDEEVFTAGKPNENEEVLTGSEGKTRSIITTKAPFTGAGGELFLVGVIRDVTESRRLEMQLRLADRMASVGTLAAGVAHEINNPLAYISSNLSFIAEQLAQEELEPEVRNELKEAVLESLEGAGRVRGIVQDLKFFARADDDTLGAVDVHRVVQGALRIVRNELQHRARITRALEQVPPARGSEARLGQVVVNLLVNAIQALPTDRPVEQNSLRIATRHQGERVYIEVEDNGLGMTPEVQQHIFDPFFTTKPAGVGTGLGLSISNSLVQIMGGWIEVNSTPGRGSTFRLVLPVFKDQETTPALSPEAVSNALVARRRVLLIDDEPSVGTAVRRLLRGLHEVHAVQDAREALRLIIRGERFDSILCDVMMLEMNGVQFLQELERLAPDMARRTGLMSGGVFDPQARAFIQERELECLPKPFDLERLRRFLERLHG
jgi:two-component system NtrC family sensor kinase